MDAFRTTSTSVRGVKQVFTHLNPGGAGPSGRGSGKRSPLLLVHGWPETRRIWWRMLQPLADAGYEVTCPDLRGFGDSDVSPDGVHDVPMHSRDLHALCSELGHETVVAVGGDLGGPVIQDLALRFPSFVEKLVLFNSPLPYDAERMKGMRTRPAAEAADYFLRQGTDADALAAELSTPDERRRYIATFYTSRFWAHPGAFTPDEVAFHTEPFADGAKLRASFSGYESVFDPDKRSEAPMMARNDVTPTMLLFGPSDHVIYPEFDRMAATVFGNRVGPFLLRDCGHFVQWEAAEVLTSAIRAWVS
jgi:pimeloyl-ACP methyl ester carboxylesterase